MEIIGFIIKSIIRLCLAIADGVHVLRKIFRVSFVWVDRSIQFYRHSVNKKSKSIYLGAKRILHHAKIVRRRKLSRLKKHKDIVIFSVPLRTKVKYFIIGGLFTALFICFPVLFFITLENLPTPYDLSLSQTDQTTKIFDRNHVLLYEIYANENRTIVPLSQVPDNLQKATIAIEDKNFYKNPGVDISAIIRAALADISGKNLQGGSTITQQLVKVSLLTTKISIIRKIQEIILAFWTEKTYTKKEILTMYFNRVPYGGTAWGVEAASEVYFGKKIHDLDLAESAFLAGIPQAPSRYSPFGELPNAWKKRQKEVLSRMKDLGYISSQEQKEALEKKLTFKNQKRPFEAPHFVMYIKNLLIDKYGLSQVEKGGLEVITSLDLHTQNAAQKIVADEIAKDTYLNISNGAAVITNPHNGDILAMVGGKDYDAEDGGNFNVTTAMRQPGSSIKVITYAAALSRGLTAASSILDAPITFTATGSAPYSPVNYDGKWHGNITIRIALANSFNIPAVKLLRTIGLPTFIDLAHNMGIKSLGDPSQYGLSLTLGGGEVTMLDMATAYGTLANQGERVDLNPILKVTDNKGHVLEEKTATDPRRILDAGVTYILSNILADDNARTIEFGTNSPLHIPDHMVSVKTGTSDDKRDNWTIGYTPHYVVTVWVGNNDNSPMNPALASGITGAAPIWHEIMTEILRNAPNETFAKPANIVEKMCSGKSEYFILGTENNITCNQKPPNITIAPSNEPLTNEPQEIFIPGLRIF